MRVLMEDKRKIEAEFISSKDIEQKLRDKYDKQDAYFIYEMQLVMLLKKLEWVKYNSIDDEKTFNEFMNCMTIKEDKNPPKLLKKANDYVDKFLKDFLEFIKEEKQKGKKS